MAAHEQPINIFKSALGIYLKPGLIPFIETKCGHFLFQLNFSLFCVENFNSVVPKQA